MPYTVWLRRIEELGNHRQERVTQHTDRDAAYAAARQLAGDENARLEGERGGAYSVDGPNGRAFISYDP